jgi:uncharacterized phage protein (TIGR02218 family)
MSTLLEHLAEGTTTVCLCWAVVRRDGVVLGFTDHDCDLEFEGISFRAGSGLTARALQQVTGLAVDNAEAVGALSDAALRAEDLQAGRYDGAEVRLWMVNWQDVGARLLRFRGHLGEVAQTGIAFRAELRGLTEALNRPMGRVIQAGCDAVLGDARCGFDLTRPGFAGTFTVAAVTERRKLHLEGLGGFEPGWFERGQAQVLSGAAAGLLGMVKSDRVHGALRVVELWEEPGQGIAVGDQLRLLAGCDRRAETCRLKFDNFLNFRGFPNVPSEDWIAASPPREIAAGRGE